MRRINPKIRKRARELRQDQTPSERKLWARLRDRQLNGLKFRRQHPIGPFITDFYFAARRLMIEIDGGGHLEQEEYDANRTKWLEGQGYRVIRFTNRDVQNNTEAVLDAILEACKGGT
jgi:very-short-patch-repair endonuclease